MKTKVKICGITNTKDAFAVIEAGADAIGLVFYQHSPRYVSVAQAVEIVSKVPPFVTVVGLFVDADQKFIKEILSKVKLTLLQFHGDESPQFCASFSLPFIKAIRVKPETNLVQYALDYQLAQGLLLDAYTDGVPGGTGNTFDWTLIPPNLSLPVILAGGLNVQNVSSAIAQVKPYAVDVSGGVELSKGIKDASKIYDFMKQVAKN